jgi:hypothetical protein
MMTIKNYTLYIGKLDDMPEGEKYTFYSPESGYLLVYSDNTDLPLGRVPAENEAKLKKTERDWLRYARMEIAVSAIGEAAREISASTAGTVAVMNEFCSNLEKELKAEADNAGL